MSYCDLCGYPRPCGRCEAYFGYEWPHLDDMFSARDDAATEDLLSVWLAEVVVDERTEDKDDDEDVLRDDPIGV